ncbi:Flp family type IVb pilin [Sporomusa malonica]|uniref:Flp/Fap pilin component n=1 Tax=Sporomusa malonica TaxID=112901 RepID=A0A1W2BG25_9FIRM|nr:Flp family type IVb pilin [Sporomusa malonica]SMC71784.1 Flp/Fap pilin component [Sporomusa malonica]
MLKMYWEMIQARYLNEKGQGMVEYGLILAVIAAIALASFTSMGTGLVAKMADIVTKLGGGT